MKSRARRMIMLPLPKTTTTLLPSLTLLRRHQKSSTLLQYIVVAFCIFAICLANPAAEIEASSNINSGYTQSIFLPLASKFNPLYTPAIRITIENVDMHISVDTGSSMTLIGAKVLPKLDKTIGTPAHEFLSSSSNLYVGRLVELPIKFHGRNGEYAVANVPILVVDKSWNCPWYDQNTPTVCPKGPKGQDPVEADTFKIRYMGVGFGRNGPTSGMSSATPAVNAFLNVVSINDQVVSPDRMRVGYEISMQGVTLGLTPAVVKGYRFTDLEPGLTYNVDPRDWAMVNMCFKINGTGRNCGGGLVDTGIPEMFIRADEGFEIPKVMIPNPDKTSTTKLVPRVKPGTQIAVGFPNFDDPAMSYSFVVDTGSRVEPSYAFPEKSNPPAFVNTGRNLLRAYSIAFDAVGGRFGFRPVARAYEQTSSWWNDV